MSTGHSALPGSTVIEFGDAGNCAAHVAAGWSGPEDGHRWTLGTRSSVTFPPVDFDGDGTAVITMLPYTIEGRPPQSLSVFLNDFNLDTFVLSPGESTYVVRLPAACMSRAAANVMTFHHPGAARPSDHGHGDTREIAISFRRLVVEPDRLLRFVRPKLAPPANPHQLDLQTILADFQSLGQNCEFGLVQRKCGIEPLGLLRFSSIFLPRLLKGLESAFEGIDVADNLKLVPHKEGGEYAGHHKIYGLDYHTFKKPHEVAVEKLLETELRRLPYLARLLIEDMTEARKIFVLLRWGNDLTPREVEAVLRLLRRYNPAASLLWVTPVHRDNAFLAGRVERDGPGLYHGHMDRLSPDGDAPDFSYECWLNVCVSAWKIWGEENAFRAAGNRGNGGNDE